MKITYQKAQSTKTGRVTIGVKLDGRKVGTIRKTNDPGWQYFPRGWRTGGTLFPGGVEGLTACMASLEGTEPRYLGPEANEVLAEHTTGVVNFDTKTVTFPAVPDDDEPAPTYANTYWSHNGKHEAQKDRLKKLIPACGEVPNPNLHPALERFRIATNCYYDLYNNGLGNRGKEFHEMFGFDAFDIGEPHWGQHDDDRDYDGYVELTQELIDRTESKMDEFILAAYAEQFPHQSGPSVPCPHCGGTGKVPTPGKATANIGF